ncbi:prostaglandin reductase 1-like [Antedon mediterranea]|uniref:prostaglandin reductase 1-like n=1 Tax=Antedon mediterranea TaxID=105859 RepID=UPI003AF4BE96
MVVQKRFVLVKHFDGMPKEGDLKIVEEKLPALKNGEILLEAKYLTVDPYMRPYSARALKEGDTMMGEQMASVTESKNPNFPVGTNVVCSPGWCTHSISDGKGIRKLPSLPKGLPYSLSLGTLGMTGMTAYFGVKEILNPKAGETLFVSGAAGAVGAVVGQFGKILGCRVIGSAGSEEKVKYLKEIGFDDAINYKTTTDNLDKKIKELCPKGIDMYFDNVGGVMTNTVMMNMNDYGRIAMCGAISGYNSKTQPTVPHVPIVSKQLKIEGFLVWRWMARYPEGIKQFSQYINEGKLKYKEHVTNGFDNMFKAFCELFTGSNFGKAIIKV